MFYRHVKIRDRLLEHQQALKKNNIIWASIINVSVWFYLKCSLHLRLKYITLDCTYSLVVVLTSLAALQATE